MPAISQRLREKLWQVVIAIIIIIIITAAAATVLMVAEITPALFHRLPLPPPSEISPAESSGACCLDLPHLNRIL